MFNATVGVSGGDSYFYDHFLCIVRFLGAGIDLCQRWDRRAVNSLFWQILLFQNTLRVRHFSILLHLYHQHQETLLPF